MIRIGGLWECFFSVDTKEFHQCARNLLCINWRCINSDFAVISDILVYSPEAYAQENQVNHIVNHVDTKLTSTQFNKLNGMDRHNYYNDYYGSNKYGKHLSCWNYVGCKGADTEGLCCDFILVPHQRRGWATSTLPMQNCTMFVCTEVLLTFS